MDDLGIGTPILISPDLRVPYNVQRKNAEDANAVPIIIELFSRNV